jgi:hypothetical protein
MAIQYSSGGLDTRAADYIDSIVALEHNALAQDCYVLQEHFDNQTAPVTATAFGEHGIIPTFATGTIARVASTLGHPGQWKISTGTVASNKPELTLGPVANFDYQTGFFGKLAARFLVRTGAVLPVGAVGATTYAEWRLGFTDTLGSLAPVSGIEWVFDIAVSPNWQLTLTAASTATKTVSTVAVAINTWYDLQLYVDAGGVQARVASFADGVAPITIAGSLLAGGPFLTNKPATTLAMQPHVLAMNGTAGVTSVDLTMDLIELAGQYVVTGLGSNYRGHDLTRSF